MSDVIKLLPDSVANQIAAGEVIQRPASVIKELVENSIDAHATSVQIILKDAGRTLIQVIDDGDGMTETDARLAFERHSTSKIRSADDLFTLHTMGFRGEALASIAAISQLELRTCRCGAEIGTHICISASKCESQEPDVCPQGCNFMIKNIFFNVPARRKFLKSNAVELSNIVREFEKLALVNPGVDFTLSHNDSVLYQLRGGTFKQRILSVFGRSLESQMIPISIDTSLVKIEGFICKPENVRRRNFLQYLFVNGRYMRHPYFHKAILTSYEQLIPADTQPNYFLDFKVDPETIDVNIHPTKTEIKFENEAPIWQILSAAVRESLGRFSVGPTIDFDVEGAPDIPVFQQGGQTDVTMPQIDIDPTYNPFQKTSSTAGGSRQSNSGSTYGSYRGGRNYPIMDWEKLYDNFQSSKLKGADAIEPEEEPLVDTTENKGFNGEQTEVELSGTTDESADDIMQIKGKYLLTTIKSGLILIDQHRAHVRVLYDKYMGQMSGDSIATQSILFPEVLHLSVSQNLIIEDKQEELEKIGFSLSNLGGTDWAINGVPTGTEGIDVKDLLLGVIDSIAEGGDSVSDKMFERIAMTVAEKAAIPYGRILKRQEMEQLISDLLKLPQPNYTPSGKIIISTMTIEQITKMFN